MIFPPLPVWTWATLLVLLALAAWLDLIQRRIPNLLLLTGASAGALLALLPTGMGLVPALSGAVLAGAAFTPLYLMRQLGGGDLKLMSTAGLLVGMPRAMALCLSVAMAGGLLALFWLWPVRRQSPLRPPPFDRMPYALAIALGSATHGWLSLPGFVTGA